MDSKQRLPMYSGPDKAFSIAVAAFSAAVLRLASSLHPSARGIGTHEQLGLVPCRFHLLTGIPCPSCGLTTSFAYAAHFQFHQAFVSSPFGLLLFCVVVLAVPTSFVLLWQRMSWLQAVEKFDGATVTMWMVVAYGASWIYKIAVSVPACFLAGW